MTKHECEHPELIDSVRDHIKDLPNREARLTRIEEAIKSVRGWAVIAAFVGGLLGRAAPDVLSILVKAAYAHETVSTIKEAVAGEVIKSVGSVLAPRG